MSTNAGEHTAPWELAAFLDLSGEALGPAEGALKTPKSLRGVGRR